MVAMHSSPNRAASSHVASVPRVAVATATATINGTRQFTNICLSICYTQQLYRFKFAIVVLLVSHLCAL